jgi:hypothetical protein
MSFQDKAQGHIDLIDKEVCTRYPSTLPKPWKSQKLGRGHVLLLADNWRYCQLSKYPALNNLEKQTSIPKVYAFLGLIATYFFFIFFNIGGQLLTNVAGFVIPGYYSLEALFTVGKADDTQWLTVNIAVLLMPCP